MKKQIYFVILILILISACTPLLDKQAEEVLASTKNQWESVEENFKQDKIERYKEIVSIKGNTSAELVEVIPSEDKKYFESITLRTKEGHRGGLSLVGHELKIYYDCDDDLNCKEVIKEARNSIEDFVNLEGKKLWFVYWDEPLSVVYITEPNYEKYFSLFEFEKEYEELIKLNVASEQDEKMQALIEFIDDKNNREYNLELIYDKKDKRAVKKEKLTDFLMQEVIDTTQLSLNMIRIYVIRSAVEDNWPEIKDLEDAKVFDLLNEKEITVLRLIEDVEYQENNLGLVSLEENDEEQVKELQDKLQKKIEDEKVTNEKVEEVMNMDENVKSKYLRLSAFEKKLVREFQDKMYQEDCRDKLCVSDMARKYNSKEFCRQIRVKNADYDKKDEIISECISLI